MRNEIERIQDEVRALQVIAGRTGGGWALGEIAVRVERIRVLETLS